MATYIHPPEETKNIVSKQAQCNMMTNMLKWNDLSQGSLNSYLFSNGILFALISVSWIIVYF